MRDIKAVIFDMDGLMFDTERLSASFWIQAGREEGLEIDEHYLSNIRGCSKEKAESWFYECFGHSFDYWSIRDRKTVLFREYLDTHEIPVKTGLRELLDFLKRERYQVVLATSTAGHYAMQYLETSGVKEYFDDFVCGDMVTNCKPDPEIFLKAAECAGAEPSQCLVLEDSFNGIRAAADGGFLTVMVPDISQPTKEIKDKLTACFGTLLEVIEFLKTNRAERKENE